jgi:anti-sigma-K factor RskA
MNWENQIQQLVNQAKMESAPGINVSGDVLKILSESKIRQVYFSERFWMWLAAASSAIAVPAVMIALITYNNYTQPLKEMVDIISWVIQ